MEEPNQLESSNLKLKGNSSRKLKVPKIFSRLPFRIQSFNDKGKIVNENISSERLYSKLEK